MYFTEDMQTFFGSSAGKIRFGENPSGLFFWRKVVGQIVLNPGVMTIALYRLSRSFYVRDQVLVSRIIDRVTEFATGAQFTGQSDFGPGLQVHHPAGLVVSPEANGGERVMLMGGVALGIRDVKANPLGQSPTLGDDVVVGSGAKVLGPIHIGDRSQVAANSVVMVDVPADAIAVGIPAKVIVKDGSGSNPKDASKSGTKTGTKPGS
ncbi:MAG: serine O-acetyltransferase [Solirubrobacterales bacterium]